MIFKMICLFQTDAMVTCQRFRYLNEAMEYVQLLQEIEERQKFEFIEIVRLTTFI